MDLRQPSAQTLLHLHHARRARRLSPAAPWCRGWRCSARPTTLPTDGGDPRQRARFMAILGLTSCALFALAIVAGAIPRWVLDACQ